MHAFIVHHELVVDSRFSSQPTRAYWLSVLLLGRPEMVRGRYARSDGQGERIVKQVLTKGRRRHRRQLGNRLCDLQSLLR
jgi:hypothetical protein